LQTKERFALYGLRFESDQSTIQADAQSLLDDIATTLKNFPDWRLRIVGHTDATGDPPHNEALSLARANAIKAALVGRGIDAQRLATAGAGQERPVAATTPQGRALNRRVSWFDTPTRQTPSDCSRRCRFWARRRQYH
jgi:outer membrane protein OmpA-like peptidoglycan-associated protein